MILAFYTAEYTRPNNLELYRLFSVLSFPSNMVIPGLKTDVSCFSTSDKSL